MDFEQLHSYLSTALKEPLPGESAQFLMAPFKRPSVRDALKASPPPRLSAVLLLVYPIENEPHLALIRRSSYKGVHSNQVSLPGGKKEESDADLLETALRETREEIGIASDHILVQGPLTEVFIPPSGFLVSPYVGVAQTTLTFSPDSREVQHLIEVPVRELLNDSIVKRAKVPAMNGTITIEAPYFDLLGNQVWGATAMILSEFKSLLQRA